MVVAKHNRRVALDKVKLKKLREAAGLSMEDAATKAGLTGRQHWHAIESGQKDIRLTTLDRIARALGVNGRDLLK